MRQFYLWAPMLVLFVVVSLMASGCLSGGFSASYRGIHVAVVIPPQDNECELAKKQMSILYQDIPTNDSVLNSAWQSLDSLRLTCCSDNKWSSYYYELRKYQRLRGSEGGNKINIGN
jgi:hypothetical protein